MPNEPPHLISETDTVRVTVQEVDEARVKLKAHFKEPTDFTVNLTLNSKAAAELGRWLENHDYI